MYQKVLIPLDGSKEAEEVFDLIQEELDENAQVVLLMVIPPGKTRMVKGQLLLGIQREEAEGLRALEYIRGVVGLFGGDPGRWDRWCCRVAVARSVSRGILDVAGRENVDLVAMCTHDRKGLARLIKGSVAEDVQQGCSVEVRVFTYQELVAVS